jgi:peptide chain release factor subunit 1
LLEGSQIKVLQKLTSGVPGKVRAGGQSSQRFHRLTEGLAKEFFRRVAEDLKRIFFDMPKLKGILIGGPIPTKEDFLDEGQLVTKLKEKIIAIKDLGYVDEHGLELLVESSQEEMAEQELIKEKKLLERFFQTLGKERNKAAYKEEEVRLALERGAVEVLLISKKLDRDKQKEFENLAENIGASVVIIGTDHTDGEQFWNLTEGLGAILRFSLE